MTCLVRAHDDGHALKRLLRPGHLVDPFLRLSSGGVSAGRLASAIRALAPDADPAVLTLFDPSAGLYQQMPAFGHGRLAREGLLALRRGVGRPVEPPGIDREAFHRALGLLTGVASG